MRLFVILTSLGLALLNWDRPFLASVFLVPILISVLGRKLPWLAPLVLVGTLPFNDLMITAAGLELALTLGW
jgi:hypothetical protein